MASRRRRSARGTGWPHRSATGTARRSSATRSSRRRPAAQVARALSSIGHPDVEVHVVLSVRDLVRQIPAEWQENIKHRAELSYGRFLKVIQSPQPQGPAGQLVLGGPGDPRHPQPLGPRPAARSRAPGDGAPPRRTPEPSLGEVQPGLRTDRPRARPRGRAREPVARRTRDRPAASDQPAGQPRSGSAALPAAGPGAPRAPDPVASDPSPRGSRCHRTRTPGPRSSPARGSTRSRSAGTT